MSFYPDYRHLTNAARNIKPERLPLYEHVVDLEIVGAALQENPCFVREGNKKSILAMIQQICRFYHTMTYDTVSYEAGVATILPGHGALYGGKPGPIQNRDDFENYPWEKLEGYYWDKYTPYFEALSVSMPEGMAAVGGVGVGIFEISEDLVGYEWLSLLQYDDPDLFADLYRRIGDLHVALWNRLLGTFGDTYCVCRMGDDLGFKSNTLLSTEAIKEHIIPQYRRIGEVIHSHKKPFLLHSCGNIFNVMDGIIEIAHIDAKHSNEDQIAPFEKWIDGYGQKIGLFGGIDVNDLCLKTPDAIYHEVVEKGSRFRAKAKGYALGSGNSIPKYVPLQGYLAMIRAAQEIRRKEG